MDKKYQSFAEFWPFYVSQHVKKVTRWMHLVGTTLMLVTFTYAVTVNLLHLLIMPIIGYGFAWVAHFFIEKNRPATFTYPLWSLLADFKMCGLMLLGKMDDEVSKVTH